MAAPASQESTAWLTIPNVLTLLRLLAIVPFAYLAMQGKDRAALLLFLIAGISDTIDGTIARRYGQASKLGRLLDPIADKLFTGVAYVVLAAFRPGLSRMPMWLMWAVVLRDVLILAGGMLVYEKSRNSGFKPSIWGKLNTLIEISVVVGFLGAADVPLFALLLPEAYIVLLVSLVISTVDYLRVGVRMAKG
jgi:cardiolipin synthase